MSQRYIGGLIYNPPGGFSGYFDGSGDYLTVASNAAFAFGTGTFTMECWIYRNVTGGANIFQDESNNSYQFYVNTSNKLEFTVSNVAIIATSSASVPTNQWVHVAVVREGTGSNQLKLYINGFQDGTGTTATSLVNSATNYIGRTGTGARELNGYISNLRILKGTALYTSNFDPPTGQLQAITNTSLLTCAYPTFRDGSSNNFTITVNGNTAVSVQNPFPLTALPNPALGNQGNGVYTMSQYQSLLQQNLWPAVDPYWEYVTLMLHGNGTNGAQNNTFLDSSTNNFTITRNGNTTQGTFTPYGSNWSAYFNGANGSKVDLASAPLPATGAFTFECFIFPLSFAAQMVVYAQYSASNTNRWNISVNTDGTVGMGGNTLPTLTSTAALTLNAWNHFAFTRDGSGNGKVFVNGVLSNSATGWSATLDTVNPRISGFANPSELCVNGYLSNLRITNTNLYTASFAVPTSPLTAVSGTTLLTLQDNRYKDNSASPITLTPASTSIQRFSPFNPTTPYAAGTIGGSGYFDGSGDYLSVADNAAFEFGSGDFTVELFAYIAATDSSGTIFVSQWNTPNRGWIFGYVNSGTTLNFDYSTTGSNAVSVNGTVTLPLNQWVHFAACRSGNTLSTYMNGARVATASVTGVTIFAPSQALEIGRNPEATSLWEMNGYLAGMRIVKGTAVYDPTQTTITVPTAPPTNITNTSLLLNFTNGGIIDNAMMNDLETVGNAQISTSVSKFGGGSMYFDGAGDVLVTRATPNLAMGTGDFTVEFWIYLNARTNFGYVFASGNGANDLFVTFDTAGNFLRLTDASTVYAVTGTIPLTTWTHVAVVRSGGSSVIYVNGVAGSAVACTVNFTSTSNAVVGAQANTNNPLNAYLDDLRITRGYARYTANFTPQRSQWQDQ